MTKLVKKPWNEGPEGKQGTKSWRAYGKYGAEMLASNGSCTKTTNKTAMLLSRRRARKAQKAFFAGKPAAGRAQLAMFRWMADGEFESMMNEVRRAERAAGWDANP
jgi:hypothetical protein